MNSSLFAIDARLIGGDMTGDSTYWNGLLHGFSQLEDDVRFLLISNNERPAGIPDDPRFEWLTVNSRRTRWWSLFRFPLKARRLGANVIHTQYNVSPLAGTHAVTTVHDVSFLICPEWFQPRDRLILQRFVPPSMRRSSRVITVSETSKREISQYYPDVKEQIRVTPLAAGPAIESFDKDMAQRTVHDDLGIESPYILTVGTRWPRKNTNLAVQAVSMLPTSIPHKLVVTGKSGWGDEETSDRVISTGYVSDAHLSALYSGADLYLAPSLHEGFGIPLLESFKCGCPVICGNGGALPETAGNAAKVMSSYEPGAWAQAIEDILHDSGKLLVMRQLGLSRVKAFSWRETAEKTLAVYHEVTHEP
ncbi:MAG: glycosyltransferase family 4 protein [Fimbriimonadaceae bacterium]|nr:glycosyltransferase family 4 protein [Fimbriimonadaceae bacterium]